MAKGKDGKKYTQAQLMALKASVRTDLARATVGKPTVDPSKGRAPKYQNNQKTFDALNAAGRFAAESVALGPVAKAAKLAYKGTYALGKTVVHSTNVQGLKTIKPTTGSFMRPKESVSFGWDTKKGANSIIGNAQQYVNKGGAPGSHYVGKMRRKDIVGMDGTEVVSKGPIKVTKEIKSKGPVQDAKSLERSLRSPASTRNKIMENQKNKRRQKEYKRNSKNSVV